MDRERGLSTVRRARLKKAAHRIALPQGGHAAMSGLGSLPQSPKSESRPPERPRAARFVARWRTKRAPHWRPTGQARPGIPRLSFASHATT